MKSRDIFIVFQNINTAQNVSKIIISAGMNVSGTLNSWYNLQKQLSYYSSGIIICGYLNDENTPAFLNELSAHFQIILIGNPQQLNFIDNPEIYKLATPLHTNQLISYLEMLLGNPFTRDEQLIARAKNILITKYNLTEKQAYTYIQKKSMSTGKKMVDIAKIILK